MFHDICPDCCHGGIEFICTHAASKGHLACLKAAHNLLIPWDAYASSFAAMGDHVDCLIYLHENDCPWDSFTYYCALEWSKDNRCLDYMYDNCEITRYNMDILSQSAEIGRQETERYFGKDIGGLIIGMLKYSKKRYDRAVTE